MRRRAWMLLIASAACSATVEGVDVRRDAGRDASLDAVLVDAHADDAVTDARADTARDGGAVMTFEGFLARVQFAICAQVARCTWSGRSGATAEWVALCADRRIDAWPYATDYALSSVRRALAAGAVRFDPAAAQRCLDLVDGGCVRADAALECAIGSMVRGEKRAGERCSSHEECAGDQWCSPGARTAGCRGVCAPRLPADAECTRTEACSPPARGRVDCFLRCMVSTDSARVPLGGSCVRGVPGQPRELLACVEGAYCDVVGSSGVCRPPEYLGEGAECDDQRYRCAPPLACVRGAPVSRCGPAPPALSWGDPCDPAVGGCPSFTVCSADNSLPGEAGLPVRCRVRDALLVELGADCGTDPSGRFFGRRCREGVCVDGRCVPRGAEGAACPTEMHCATDLVCVDGACRALAPLGAACLGSNECASQACVDRRCVEEFCPR